MFKTIRLALVAGIISGAASAQETPRTVLTDPYTAENARAAMDEVRARYAAVEAADLEKVDAGEMEMWDFMSSLPVFQAVSWPDSQCTDWLSLFPSPPEGWAIPSDWGSGEENTFTETEGLMRYVLVPEGRLTKTAFTQI